MITKYEMLINSLDEIADKAPSNFGRFKITTQSTEEEINQIRSNAYIHLLLLVKFGVQDYKKRFAYITYDCQLESEPRADLILSHLTLA